MATTMVKMAVRAIEELGPTDTIALREAANTMARLDHRRRRRLIANLCLMLSDLDERQFDEVVRSLGW